MVHVGFGNPKIDLAQRIANKKNVPGYLAAQDKFKAKGIDEIIIFCINDAAVMDAWADAQKVGRDGQGSILNFIADTSGELTDKLDMRMNHDGPRYKFAQDRTKRFAAYVDHGVVKILNVAEGPSDPAGDENPSKSLAEKMLADMSSRVDL